MDSKDVAMTIILGLMIGAPILTLCFIAIWRVIHGEDVIRE
jgi:hypothetical protein